MSSKNAANRSRANCWRRFSNSSTIRGVLRLSRIEGIIPALESAHAVAEAIKRAPLGKGKVFIVNLSGRGDKDIDIYRENFKELDSQ